MGERKSGELASSIFKKIGENLVSNIVSYTLLVAGLFAAAVFGPEIAEWRKYPAQWLFTRPAEPGKIKIAVLDFVGEEGDRAANELGADFRVLLRARDADSPFIVYRYPRAAAPDSPRNDSEGEGARS